MMLKPILILFTELIDKKSKLNLIQTETQIQDLLKIVMQEQQEKNKESDRLIAVQDLKIEDVKILENAHGNCIIFFML